MKVFLCGQKSFGREVLRRLLADGHEMTGVACPPPQKYYDKLHGAALKERVGPIVYADRLRSSDIRADTELIVAAHAHHFLSARALERAGLGGIGFHPSLLPRHRGRDAVRWTVAFGDIVTGGTVYWLDDRVDAGPIHSQRMLWVDPAWDHHALWRRLFPIGVEMVAEACGRIGRGERQGRAQEERFATWEPAWEATRLHRPELPQIPAAEQIYGEAV